MLPRLTVTTFARRPGNKVKSFAAPRPCAIKTSEGKPMRLMVLQRHWLNQAPMVEACRSMPQHLILWPVGGGFEACRSMPQHTKILAQTKL